MKNLHKLLFLLLCTPLFMACPSATEDFDIDFGYDYYPIDVGHFWEYQVDSVVYRDLGATRDSTSSFIKEEIVEKFIDQTNDTIFRIERTYKEESQSTAVPVDQWATSIDESLMTRTEENLQYIKMVYPVEVDDSWDGNAFINESTTLVIAGESIELFIDFDYKVLSVNEQEEINGVIYNDVLTIQNADNFDPNLPLDTQNKLERRLIIEKYARGIGLVYKKHLIVDTQCLAPECDDIPWDMKAEKGYGMEMFLIDYGK